MTQTGKKDRKQIVLRLSPELYDALAIGQRMSSAPSTVRSNFF